MPAAPEVEFLDAADGAGVDEVLPEPRSGRRRRWWALALIVVAVAGLTVRGVLDRPKPSATPSNTETVPVLGPGGVYEEVPYVPAPGGNPADVGHLLRCSPGATCIVRSDLPVTTLTALRVVFPALRIQSSWTVVVRGPSGTAQRVQSRQVFGVVGSHTIEVDVRPAVASDVSLRFARATVEGTRSVWATASGRTYVRASAFERYESTGGVLDRLGTLVRGGTLLAAQ